MKVSQFGDTLLEAWKQALNEKLHVNCGGGVEGKKKAIHLRYRLYMLRTAMKKENHPLADHIFKIKLKIDLIGSKWILQGVKVDSELEQILHDSGVVAPKVPDLPDLDL